MLFGAFFSLCSALLREYKTALIVIMFDDHLLLLFGAYFSHHTKLVRSFVRDAVIFFTLIGNRLAHSLQFK